MSAKSRIVLVNQYFYPSDAATAVLLRELVEDISGEFDLSVVCESAASEVPEDTRYRMIRFTPPAWAAGGRSVVSPLLRWVTSFLFIVRTTLFLLTQRRSDLVVLASEPPFLDMLGGGICVLRKQRFVLIVQDLYPEFAEGVGLQPVATCAWPLKRIHSWVARRAAKVIAISEDHVEMLAKRGVLTGAVIPNWAPTSCAAEEPTPLPSLDGPLILHYAGNLGLACDLDALEEALAILSRRGELENVRLTIRGDGIKRHQAERLAVRYSQVSYQPRVPVGEVHRLMGGCHAHLVLMPERLRGCVYPSKTNSIMRAARPIIASIPRSSALASFIITQGVGYVSSAEAPSELAACMMRCMRDLQDEPTMVSEMGARGWRYTAQQWTRPIATGRYQEVFRQAIQGV